MKFQEWYTEFSSSLQDHAGLMEQEFKSGRDMLARSRARARANVTSGFTS